MRKEEIEKLIRKLPWLGLVLALVYFAYGELRSFEKTVKIADFSQKEAELKVKGLEIELERSIENKKIAAKLVNDYSDLYERIPASTELPEILRLLHKTATSSGILISEITTKKTTALSTPELENLFLTIKFGSNYESVRNFVAILESLVDENMVGAHFSISRLHLSESSKAVMGLMKLNLLRRKKRTK